MGQRTFRQVKKQLEASGVFREVFTPPTPQGSGGASGKGDVQDRSPGTSVPILTPETGHWSTPLRDIVWDKEKQAFRIREIGFLLVLVGTGYVFIQDNQRGIPTIPSLAFTLFKCGALTVVIAVLTSLYRLISDDGKASMDLINTRRNWGTAGVCILCAASFYYFGFDRGRIGVLADQHADQSRRFIHGARERAVEATEVLYGSDLERIRTKHAERLRIAMALYKPNE